MARVCRVAIPPRQLNTPRSSRTRLAPERYAHCTGHISCKPPGRLPAHTHTHTHTRTHARVWQPGVRLHSCLEETQHADCACCLCGHGGAQLHLSVGCGGPAQCGLRTKPGQALAHLHQQVWQRQSGGLAKPALACHVAQAGLVSPGRAQGTH